MGNRVPLHALVLVLLRDHASSVAEAYRRFPAHEVLTPQTITTDLVGQPDRPDLLAISLREMQRRVALKLSLGERVVIAAPGLVRAAQRAAFSRLAGLQGAAVVYWLSETAEPDLLTGDGVAQTVFATQHPHVVLPLPGDALAFLRGRFRGVTVIADVHGDLAGLQAALAWARQRQHFVWFLGDVIDCGPQTLEVLVVVYHMVMGGEAGFILGNHERKIARWMAQQDSGDGALKLSPGNRVTVAALTALTEAQRRQWSGRFRCLLSRAALMHHLGTVTLTHAAVHQTVWQPCAAAPADDQAVENYALYGEHGHSHRDGLSYHWIDAVPAGQIVFVGHDIRSTVAPVVIKGRQGGQVVFLDTGAGKGGLLSSADLRFVGSGLRLENFNRH